MLIYYELAEHAGLTTLIFFCNGESKVKRRLLSQSGLYPDLSTVEFNDGAER